MGLLQTRALLLSSLHNRAADPLLQMYDLPTSQVDLCAVETGHDMLPYRRGRQTKRYYLDDYPGRYSQSLKMT
jgi:hypothetical protein